MIRSGKAAGFAVGADLEEFELRRRPARFSTIEYGQRVYQQLARLPCPTVCAIHGHCMGGGTELALACRFRVAARRPSTRIGLPEGEARPSSGLGQHHQLPRLIGAPQALEIMLTRRTVSTGNAKALGLVDRVSRRSFSSNRRRT